MLNKPYLNHIKTLTKITKLEDYGDQPVKIKVKYGVEASRNQHPYFTVTGFIYLPCGKGSFEEEPESCGVIHDEILEAFPELSDIVGVHLNNAVTGEPMYALENGFFIFKNQAPYEPQTYYDGQVYEQHINAARYLGVQPEQLVGIATKEQFAEFIEDVRPTWQKIASDIVDKYGFNEVQIPD